MLRRPICSPRNNAASASAISGAMKLSAIASASGTRAIPQKNAIAMIATTTLRAAWMRRTRRLGKAARWTR